MLDWEWPVSPLMEQTGMIVQACAAAAKAQSGNEIQEAGGQAAQPSIAKGGFILFLFNFRKIYPISGEKLFRLIKYFQINEIIRQKLANQKRGGNIVQLLLTLNLGWFAISSLVI